MSVKVSALGRETDDHDHHHHQSLSPSVVGWWLLGRADDDEYSGEDVKFVSWEEGEAGGESLSGKDNTTQSCFYAE